MIGNKIIKLEQTESTNRYASFLLKNNQIENGTIVRADYQTSGTGHSGSKWESDSGENLLFSIVLTDCHIEIENHFYLSKFVCIALCKYVRDYIPDTYIKWPNDIISNHNKISGILIENSVMQSQIKTSIIGIGLNVNQELFSKKTNATSLKLEIKDQLDLNDILQSMLTYFDNELQLLLDNNFKKLDRQYIDMLFRYNIWAQYKMKDHVFKGKIIDIAPTGELVMENEKGEILYFGFKEIVFL